MMCVFKAAETPHADGPRRLVCVKCGHETRPTAWEPGRVRRTCSATTTTGCVHIGPEVRQQVCNTCTGKQRIKIFGCAVHHECTLGKQLDGITCCKGCGDYMAAQPNNSAGASPIGPS